MYLPSLMDSKFQSGTDKLDGVPYDEDEVTLELRYVKVSGLTHFYRCLIQFTHTRVNYEDCRVTQRS